MTGKVLNFSIGHLKRKGTTILIGEKGEKAMKSRFRLFSLVAVLLFGLAMVASFGSTASAAEKLVLRMAGQSPIEYQGTIHQMEFKKTIEAATKGRIQIKVYPANQLGDYTQVYEEIMKGTIDMALISVPSQFDQRLELTYVPYLAENYDQVKKFFAQNGFLFNTLGKVHDKLNVKLLGFNIEGFGGLGCTKPLVEPANPAVKKGILLRVPPMDVFKSWALALNFQTVTVPYAELYTALQTGVAEGWIGGAPVLTYLSFRDVIKYYYQYNGHVESESWLINKDLWNKLDKADQKLFLDTVAKLQTKSIAVSEKEDKEYLKKLADESKIKVTTFSNAELKKFAETVRKTAWPKLKDRLTPEIMDALMKQY